MRWPVLLVLLLGGSASFADEVILRGGGRVSGVIVERTPDFVTLEVGPGRVRIAVERIETINASPSALAEYNQRASRLGPSDLDGWIALAEWARTAELETQARAAWERILSLSPGNERANRALGRVPHEGQWMTQEEVYRAKGLVQFEGNWISPADLASIEATRAREAELRAKAAEDQRRSREAEARQAEASAREAEAQSQSAPWGWGYGGSYCGGYPGVSNCLPPGDWERPDGPPVRPKPEPPPPPPPTSSLTSPAKKGSSSGSSIR